jgi:hypothetical protein
MDHSNIYFFTSGMGLQANEMEDPCSVAVPILDMLTEAGYKLYALPTVVHKKPWDSASPALKKYMRDWKNRPLRDYKADCEHFLDYETNFPNPDYHMGYWTDILAVAPDTDAFIPESSNPIRNGAVA